MKTIIEYVNYLLRIPFFIYSYFSTKSRILFIPHSGMARVDKYNIRNYKSDCALSLANFILENNLLYDKIITIVISESSNELELTSYINETFGSRQVEFVYCFDPLSSKQAIIKRLYFYKAISQSSHIFTSITYMFRPLFLKKQQVVVDLGYYSCPFKSDLFLPNSSFNTGVKKVSNKDCHHYITTSEFSSRLILPIMSIPYENFIPLGMCRNDYLIKEEDLSSIRNQFISRVCYDVKKIILYTPTHRDYEQSMGNDLSRELLGFEADLNKLNESLIDNQMLIVCKLHPKQNINAIKRQVPQSIIVYEPDGTFGLTELMKISDALLTDYTSGYFDYLLLDKPVIFNFYDIELYKKTRGFTFEPIESICAGEIVSNELTLIESLNNLNNNYIQYQNKRDFVKNLVFANIDNNSCRRVFDYFFS